MMRLASASFLRRMTSSARSSVTVYGSSSFSEAYLLPYFTYGPKRPTLATMVSPSGVSPSVRGSLNSSIASASVIESIFCPGRSPAKRGFSSSSLVPICTNGPKRPMRTAMGLPVAGSLPSSRACATCSRVTVRSIFSTCWMKGFQNLSSGVVHSSSPRDTASSSSSMAAVKPYST